MTSPHTDKSPVHLVEYSFGNLEGRDFILEPSSDFNEINGATLLRVSPEFPSVCGWAENGVFGHVKLALSLPPIWFTLFFFKLLH